MGKKINVIIDEDQILDQISEEALRKEFIKRGEIIDIFWCKDDIRLTSTAKEANLTEQEVDDIAGNIARKHDAEYGINWDLIDFWINETISNRKKN